MPPILGFVLCWLMAPGIAGAATLDNPGIFYDYWAEAGEANTLRIDADGDSYTLTDSVPIRDRWGACTRLSATSLDCPRATDWGESRKIHVRLDDGDTAPNSFRYFGPPPDDSPDSGRSGDTADLSVMSLSSADDDIVLSSGDDYFASYGGADRVVGGDGADSIHSVVPEDGPDTIRDGGGPGGYYAGGGGNDWIQAVVPESDDTISGGEGDDDLDAASLGVSADDWGHDTLLGEGGNDDLYTLPDSTGDHLDGGAGDDSLTEGSHSWASTEFCKSGTPTDVNIGGSGRDSVFDLCGFSDVFRLLDGERDVWACAGTYARADLDPIDVRPSALDVGVTCRVPGLALKAKKTQEVKKLEAEFTCSPGCTLKAKAKAKVGRAKAKSKVKRKLAAGERTTIRFKLKNASRLAKLLRDTRGRATIIASAKSGGVRDRETLKVKLKP
jgi:hypothetical protein